MKLRAGGPVVAATLIALGTLAFWYTRLVLPAWRQPFAASFGNVDLFAQIYPMSFRAAAWIREGTIPLWNPHQFAGHPFLATALYGVCYPPNAVHLFLPTAIAIEATIVLHLALAGWFTFLYAGALGLRPLAGYAGATVYVGCGFMTSTAIWFTPAIAAAAWLPLALFAVERIVQRAEPRGAALLAVAVGCCLLAGWPQLFLYSVYAIAVYAGVRLVGLAWTRDTRPRVPRITVLLGLGLALGLAVAAVQVLPTRELQTLGPRRPGGLTMEQLVPFGPMPPSRLVAETLDWRPYRPFLAPFYLGPIVVALTSLSVFGARARASIVALWVVLVASAFVALALNTTFFEQVFLRVPGARLFRLPHRIVILYAFSSAVLTAFGVDALLRRGTQRLARLAVAFVVLGACGLWFARGGRAPDEIWTIAGAAVLLAAAVLVPHERARRAVVALLLLLVVGNFARATSTSFRRPFHETQSLHRQDAMLDYIREHQGLGRTYLHEVIGFDYAITPKQGTLHEIYSISDYEPLSLVRFAELFAAIDKPRPSFVPFAGALWIRPEDRSLRLLDVLSLRYMVVDRRNEAIVQLLDRRAPSWRRVPILPADVYALYELAEPLPRAFVAAHATVVRDRAAGLAAMQADGFDPRQTVVVESVDGLPAPSGGSSAVPAPIVAARITRYEPREVRIEADAAAAGWLVLTDTFYPGWVATVDGAPVPIHPANHVVRAVPVSAGAHVVTFRYEPTSVRVGAVVSGIVSMVIVAMAIGGSRRRAATRTPPARQHD